MGKKQKETQIRNQKGRFPVLALLAYLDNVGTLFIQLLGEEID